MKFGNYQKVHFLIVLVLPFSGSAGGFGACGFGGWACSMNQRIEFLANVNEPLHKKNAPTPYATGVGSVFSYRISVYTFIEKTG
ncbi:MAG: hypothetical protein LBJ10_06820 [Clostridiales bacterium]|nr:hypothetical protein [Clostridiales bacterium]